MITGDHCDSSVGECDCFGDSSVAECGCFVRIDVWLGAGVECDIGVGVLLSIGFCRLLKNMTCLSRLIFSCLSCLCVGFEWVCWPCACWHWPIKERIDRGVTVCCCFFGLWPSLRSDRATYWFLTHRLCSRFYRVLRYAATHIDCLP